MQEMTNSLSLVHVLVVFDLSIIAGCELGFPSQRLVVLLCNLLIPKASERQQFAGDDGTFFAVQTKSYLMRDLQNHYKTLDFQIAYNVTRDYDMLSRSLNTKYRLCRVDDVGLSIV